MQRLLARHTMMTGSAFEEKITEVEAKQEAADKEIIALKQNQDDFLTKSEHTGDRRQDTRARCCDTWITWAQQW